MKALITIFSILAMTSSALAVKIVGNGGDTYAVEFVSVASDVLNYLKTMQSGEVDLVKLENAMKTTKVESTDQKLVLNGVPKDAINYPKEARIIFNRTAWGNSKEGLKPKLVLHEYLGIIGMNDSSYALSTSLLVSFGYGKNVTEVDGPFTVNFVTKNEYLIDAHVTLENYGPQDWHYNSDNERIRLVIEYKGKRKVFQLPTKGRVISAHSDNGGEDNGIYISILQPLKDKKGQLEIIEENNSNSEYIKHVIRDYRIEFNSKTKDAIPDDADFGGPVSNLAG